MHMANTMSHVCRRSLLDLHRHGPAFGAQPCMAQLHCDVQELRSCYYRSWAGGGIPVSCK